MTPLLVTNISSNISRIDLKNVFQRFGKVIEVNAIRDKDGQPTGTMVVKFLSANSAEKALELLQGVALDGHPLKIKYPEQKPVIRYN